MLPLAQANIDANFGPSAARRIGTFALPRTAELLWSATPARGADGVDDAVHPPYDVVVMSDVLYRLDSVPLLVATLRWLCGPHTEVFKVYELRNAEIEAAFHEQASRHFEVTPIAVGSFADAGTTRRLESELESPLRELRFYRMVLLHDEHGSDGNMWLR